MVSAGVSEHDFFESIRSKANERLEADYKARDSVHKTIDQITDESYNGNRAFTGKWKGLTFSQFGEDKPTGLSTETLKQYANSSVQTPNAFEVHQRIKKHHVQSRLTQIEKNTVDWATAEAVAFASLIGEGYNIRFSGQDVERGTFSHRHLFYTDVNSEQKWSPFAQAWEGFKPKGRFHLGNSPLSEASVLSFELGYSMENPQNLVVWEAQFGDFFNPAQVKLFSNWKKYVDKTYSKVSIKRTMTKMN